MASDDRPEEAVPGLHLEAASEREAPLLTLEVDGELFEVRARGGGTDYDWTSGPNQGYGFGTSRSPHVPEEQHRQSIRGFLDMIDPATGYVAED